MDKIFKFTNKDSGKNLSIKCMHALKMYDIITKEKLDIYEKVKQLKKEFPNYFYPYPFIQKAKYIQEKFLIEEVNKLLEPLFIDMDKYCKDTIQIIKKNKQTEQKDIQKFFRYLHSLD